MNLTKLKVRPQKKSVVQPCAVELTSMLGCWASSGDLGSAGPCKEAAMMLKQCMSQPLSMWSIAQEMRCTCGRAIMSTSRAASYSTASADAPSAAARRTRLFPRIPSPRGPYQTAQDVLKASPRTAPLADKVQEWQELFKHDGESLKKLELPIKERKYALWYLEKFRQGYDPKQYDIKLKPKKKVRGWGDAIQNGKRVR